MPLGRRVAHLRTQQRITQQVLAERVGKSKSWLDKVERGDRALDRLSVIYDIAYQLEVDPQLLLGDPEPGPAAGAHRVVPRLRLDLGQARRDVVVLMRRHLPPTVPRRSALLKVLTLLYAAVTAEGIAPPARARIIATVCAGLAQRRNGGGP